MTAPFVSHDGADANGVRAEVWVQKGEAYIDEVRPPRTWNKPFDPNGSADDLPRNVMVIFRNEVLRDGVSGWVSTRDPLYPTVLEAFNSHREVSYRVEWQRNRDLPRDTPVKTLRGYNEATGKSSMDMSRDNGSSILAAVDKVFSKEAVTNPAEDPGSAAERISALDTPTVAAPAATSGGDQKGKALAALAAARKHNLPGTVQDALVAAALIAGATPDEVNVPSSNDGAAPTRRAAAREAAPYLEFNSDNRPNLGSQAMAGAVYTMKMAESMLRGAALRAAEDEGEDEQDTSEATREQTPVAVPFEDTMRLANLILQITDSVQVTLNGWNRPDRMANSHRLAREVLRNVTYSVHPLPGDPAKYGEWANDVAVETCRRMSACTQLAASPATARVVQPPQPERPAPLREGEDGFTAATAEQVAAFTQMCEAAVQQGVTVEQVAAFVEAKFGTSTAEKAHGPALAALMAWYSQRPVDVFCAHITDAANAAEATKGASHDEVPAGDDGNEGES